MATFPGGIASFTNPTSGDNLEDEVGGLTHSEQHGAVNDEVEAIETELGTNPSGSESTVAARFTTVEGRVTTAEGDITALESTVAALPGGDARIFDVVTYGAAVDGATDDTTAWQDAIDAAAAAGGGVVTSSLNGVSVIGGALQDTGGANAQLTLPVVDVPDDPQIGITIRGMTPPPLDFSVGSTMALPVDHLVLKSTLASGTGAVIGGYGPSGSSGNFTNVHARFENVAIRTVSNPTISGLDLRHVATVELDNVTVDPGFYAIGALTEPTSTGSFGVRLPTNNNGACTRLGTVAVIGFYNGFEHSEHAVFENVSAWGCKVGSVPTAANHASVYQRFMAVHCERGIKPSGAHPLDVWQFDIEHAASGWAQTDYDIDDASNYLTGFVRWWSVLAGTGPHNSFAVNSATGITASRVGAAIGSGGGSLVVKEEGSTTTAAATTMNFVGAGVTATDVAGVATVTVPGGSGYVYRDRLVAASGDVTLTLGATPVANSPLVWVNGAIKWPTTDYTVSSNVITFGSSLSASDVVAVQYHSAASSASASVLTGPTVNIVDTFTRANSTSSLGSTSTGSLPWTAWSGTWGISSNQAYVSSGAAAGTDYAVVDSGVANVTVSAVITRSSGTPNAGLIVRGSSITDFLLAEIVVAGAYTPKIYKVVAGVSTVIATGSSITFASGDTLSVVTTATTVTVKRNGTTIVSVTDSTHATNTKQGLYSVATSGAASAVRHDDFSVQP